MNTDNRTNDELDDILADLGGVIDSIKPSRVDIEKPAATPTGAYFSLEEEETPAEPETPAVEVEEDVKVVPENTSFESVMTSVLEEEEEAKVFEGTDSVVEEDTMAATQVIDLYDEEEVPAKKSRKAKKRSRKEIDPADLEESTEEEVESYRKAVKGEVWGCLKTVIYIVVVVAVAVGLASYIIRAGLDFTGIGRSTMMIDLTVAEGSSTRDIAELLANNDIIKDPFIFRVYCRVMGEDGTFHPGVHTVSPSMGYDGIVSELQKTAVRETVSVTIPEGTTVENIAKILEENSVCSSSDFYTALVTVDYGADYDFIAELTEAERQNRVYLLEGYLFPDTYEFYKEGAAETVIRSMLDNFATRVSKETRDAIKASGGTLNEVLIKASIIQMEAGFPEDMPRVARVMQNRLDNPSEFPLLQMDSTSDYLANLMPSSGGAAALDTSYDTYVREGLPVGAICNPGLDAINAALNPSEEPTIINCFYFASIVETGETAFFETFAAHEAWCIEHGVGMYG